MTAGLPESSLAELLEAISEGSGSAIKKVPGITNKVIISTTNATKTAYAQSFRTVFLVGITFGGLSTIAALVSIPVDDKLDNIIAAKLSGTGASQEAFNFDEEK